MIGKSITAMRKKRGITQEELAYMLSINITTLSRWENEHFEPKASVVKKFCEVLNCTEAELLNEPLDGRFQITISWNWEEMKKGSIDMDKEKFKLILGEDGAIGLQGAGKFNNREAIEEFIAEINLKLLLKLRLDEELFKKHNERRNFYV